MFVVRASKRIDLSPIGAAWVGLLGSMRPYGAWLDHGTWRCYYKHVAPLGLGIGSVL
jgi:hypothetical protein